MGLQLACLTNKPGAFARDLLRLKGLDLLFDSVFGADACPLVLERHGYNHGQALSGLGAFALVDRLDEIPAQCITSPGRS